MLPASRAGNLYFYPRGLMSILTDVNRSQQKATESNKKQQNATTPEELREAAKYRLQLEKSHIVDHLATFYPKKAVLVGECGTSRHYERYEYIATHAPLRLLSWANFCHLYKFCPVCSRIYSLQNAADLHGRIRHLQRERKSAMLSPFRYLFLTLTVKNCALDKLRETLRAMSRGWQRFVNTKRFKAAVPGGWFRGVEYLGDHTEPGKAHPHYHALLIVDASYFRREYIKQSEWAQMWRDAMRLDYDPQVCIKRIKPRLLNEGITKAAAAAAGNAEASERVESALGAAVAEVCKYCVAPAAVARQSHEDFRQLYQQTLQCRIFALGGLLKGTTADPPDEIDPEDLRYLGTEIWHWAHWREGGKKKAGYLMTDFVENKQTD